MSRVAPANVDFAGGIGVTHGDGIVDEDEFDLEGFFAWNLPKLASSGAIVLHNDRRPARPDIESELDGAGLERLVSGGFLDRRELFPGFEGVFLDGGGDIGVIALDTLRAALGQLFL